MDFWLVLRGSGCLCYWFCEILWVSRGSIFIRDVVVVDGTSNTSERLSDSIQGRLWRPQQ